MTQALAVLIGAAAAMATVRWSRRPGRPEPRFWMWILIVMQAIYLAFAVAGRDPGGVALEAALLALFTAVAVAGVRWSSWILALGILAHGLWDLRHLFAARDYVIPLYPEACLGYDGLVFVFLAASAAAWDRARRLSTARGAAT